MLIIVINVRIWESVLPVVRDIRLLHQESVLNVHQTVIRVFQVENVKLVNSLNITWPPAPIQQMQENALKDQSLTVRVRILTIKRLVLNVKTDILIMLIPILVILTVITIVRLAKVEHQRLVYHARTNSFWMVLNVHNVKQDVKIVLVQVTVP